MTKKVYDMISSEIEEKVMAKSTDSHIKSVYKHRQENVKRLSLDLNKNTDKDILTHLEKVPSKLGYIKKLIRDDINGVTLPLGKVFQLIEFINDNTLNCYSYSERTLTLEMKDVNLELCVESDSITWESYIKDVIGLNVDITYGCENFATIEFK